MENKPKLTVSGYRGIWGESLNNEIVRNYTEAFIKFVKENIKENPTILIGRDGRETGEEIKKVIINCFKNSNINFVDGDILPTPTVLFSVRKFKYDGAIIITASHNPREYNGLKFVTNKGLFTNEKEVEIIKNNYLKIDPKTYKEFDQINEKQGDKIIDEYINQILSNINVNKIKERKFKIAVDMINASACVIDKILLNKLGVDFIPLNDTPNGIFAHKPEPLKENLSQLGEIVKKNNCDVGFAHDPDADRLVIVNEFGEVISEEYTVAIGILAVLSKTPGNVVINMSTSQMDRDIAENYGGKCIRTKVGEANVVAGIIENNAIIGGEGNGGVIYPKINLARDSFVSMALVLEFLAEKNQTLSECLKLIPKYNIRKDKLDLKGDLNEIYNKVKENFKDATYNELDGLRLDFPNGSWIHLRPSNTEPIVRLIGEAKEKVEIDELFKKTISLI